MPTLHIICGMPGSGKTTLAMRLEREEPALRLSPDEWMSRIVRDGYDDERRAAIHDVQYDIARRVLQLGVSVVLETGFWARNERDAMRTLAREAGAGFRLHYLDVPLDELKRRLAARNSALPPDTFPVDPDVLDDWIRQFEAPTPDELAG